MSGNYKIVDTKVIILGEYLTDFMVINKRQYQPNNPNESVGAIILETQLVIAESTADTENGLSIIPAKTVAISETGLKNIYKGLKEIFEPNQDNKGDVHNV